MEIAENRDAYLERPWDFYFCSTFLRYAIISTIEKRGLA